MTLQKEVMEKMAELERKDIIKKVAEPTPSITRMVVVTKSGKIKISLDRRDLNKVIQKPKYEMLTLEEILPKLSKAKVSTTLTPKMVFTRLDEMKKAVGKQLFGLRLVYTDI